MVGYACIIVLLKFVGLNYKIVEKVNKNKYNLFLERTYTFLVDFL